MQILNKVLYCIVLYCIVLYCIVLYCTKKVHNLKKMSTNEEFSIILSNCRNRIRLLVFVHFQLSGIAIIVLSWGLNHDQVFLVFGS